MGGVSPSTHDSLRIVVNELVANSLRHGGLGQHDHIDVTVETRPDHLRVDVYDRGVGFTHPSADKRRSGIGLAMVQRLARHFGISRNGHTHAWAEISRA